MTADCHFGDHAGDGAFSRLLTLRRYIEYLVVGSRCAACDQPNHALLAPPFFHLGYELACACGAAVCIDAGRVQRRSIPIKLTKSEGLRLK